MSLTSQLKIAGDVSPPPPVLASSPRLGFSHRAQEQEENIFYVHQGSSWIKGRDSESMWQKNITHKDQISQHRTYQHERQTPQVEWLMDPSSFFLLFFFRVKFKTNVNTDCYRRLDTLERKLLPDIIKIWPDRHSFTFRDRKSSLHDSFPFKYLFSCY